MSLWQFLLTNRSEVLSLTGQHLWMVFVSVSIAAAIGIPGGVLMTRRPRLETLLRGTCRSWRNPDAAPRTSSCSFGFEAGNFGRTDATHELSNRWRG